VVSSAEQQGNPDAIPEVATVGASEATEILGKRLQDVACMKDQISVFGSQFAYTLQHSSCYDQDRYRLPKPVKIISFCMEAGFQSLRVWHDLGYLLLLLLQGLWTFVTCSPHFSPVGAELAG
jgi:hypothetical protein